MILTTWCVGQRGTLDLQGVHESIEQSIVTRINPTSSRDIRPAGCTARTSGNLRICESDTRGARRGVKLVNRLYRSSQVRDRAIPGSGLGLALSRAVVHRHHGTIQLAERDGPGTTVMVRLPLDSR